MSSPAFIRVRNWRRFQVFKNRRPPWIKLYNDLLEKPEFRDLPNDAARFHLVGIFLLASRFDNELPADPAWIAHQIGATAPVDLGALDHFLEAVQAASKSDSSNDSEGDSAVSLSSLSLSDNSQGDKGGVGGQGETGEEPDAGEKLARPGEEPAAPSGAGGERLAADVRSVLSYLNELTGAAYQPGPDTEYLAERLLEGWTLEQCEQAVEAAMGRRGELGELHPKRMFSRRWFDELRRQRAEGRANLDWMRTVQVDPPADEIEELDEETVARC